MLNYLRVNRTVNLAFGDSMGWFMQLISGDSEDGLLLGLQH